MTETILQILTWTIPSGGIGAAIAWVANRRMRRSRDAKEVHDTYKEMYNAVSEELLALQNQTLKNYEKTEELIQENVRTRRSLNRLSRAIEAIQLCPYRAKCPVRAELQDSSEGGGLDTTKPHGDEHGTSDGQRKRSDRKKADAVDSSRVVGEADDSGGQSANSS